MFQIIKYFLSPSHRSFSQNGEDLLLNQFFQGKKTGFYIDIGSHHPIILNNSYFFYRRGWKGICIEGNTQFNRLYKIFRPRDIFINAFLSDKEEELFYYQYQESVFNYLSEVKTSENDEYIMSITPIKTTTLLKVLTPYLKSIDSIDFISIDVEKSNWNVLKQIPSLPILPKIIIFESDNIGIENIVTTESYEFIKRVGYEAFAVVFNNIFFKLQTQ